MDFYIIHLTMFYYLSSNGPLMVAVVPNGS